MLIACTPCIVLGPQPGLELEASHKGDRPMFRLTVSYVRYALTALSAVAFGSSLN